MLESSFALMIEAVPELPIATGNVVPYAKVDSLVVNDGFWASLSDAQQTIVQDAANATRAWAINNLVKDADAAASYCETGGSVVLADPESVDQFRAAASDVVAELAKDATTDALMTKMRAAATGLSPEPVEACEAPIAMTIKPDGGDLPDGIYRIEYTDEYLESWGVTDVNFQHGIWTYRLEDGHWTIDQRADDITDHMVGIYQVKGRDLYWRWDKDPGTADRPPDLVGRSQRGPDVRRNAREPRGLDVRIAVDPRRSLARLTETGAPAARSP